MRGTIKKIATIVFVASMVGLFFKPVSVNAYMENEMNEISITDTDGELLGMLAFEINSIPVAYASFPNQSVEAPNYTTGVASTSELSSRLNALISKYQGTYWTSNGSACSNHSSTCYSKYYYGWQCKGFASYIFNDLFCGGYIGAYDSDMYYIPSANNATLVGKSWGFSSTDTATVKSILSKGQVGDFIQVRRRDKSYGHSMILAGVDANGIYVFDCNSDGKCGVKYYHQTWATFASENSGMSLYHSTKYPTVDNWKYITSFGFDSPMESQEISDRQFRFQGWAVCTKTIKSITCSINDGQKYITASLYTREDVPNATAFLADIPTVLLNVGNNKIAVCINYSDGTGEVADYRYVNRTRPTYILGYDSPTDNQKIDTNTFLFNGWLEADKEIKEISCSLNDGKKYFIANLYKREDVPNATAFQIEIGSSWLNYGDNAVSVCVGYKDGTSETVGRRIVKKVIADAIDSPEENVMLKNDSDTLHLGGWSLHDNKKIDRFEYEIGSAKYTLSAYKREDLSENALAFTSHIPATRFKESVNKLNVYVCYTDGSRRLIGTRTVNRHIHNYGEWMVTKEATCTEMGSKKRMCTGCDKYETQQINSLGHNFVNSVCSICGAKDPNASQEVCEVFADVLHDTWYEEAVQYVYDNGIMSGSAGLFSPNNSVTRSMVVETLYKMEGKPAVSDFAIYDQYTDLDRYQWWANSVSWAMNLGIATGDNYYMKFNPETAVTREQLATFLYRYAKYKNLDVTLSKDASAILGGAYVNSYARDAFAWAVDIGLISGVESNGLKDLNSQGVASRAQMAAIMQRLANHYKDI